MLQIFTKLMNVGIRENHDPISGRYIKLVNIFSVVFFFLVMANIPMVVKFLPETWPWFWMGVLPGILWLVAIVLNYYQQYFPARLLVCLFPNIHVFLLAFFNGLGTNIHLFYLIHFILPNVIFPYNERKWLYGFVGIVIGSLLFLEIWFLNHQAVFEYSESFESEAQVSNIIAILAFSFVTLLYHYSIFHKTEQTVIAQKDEIMAQHKLLIEQRDQLEDEKDKTQKLLSKIEVLFGQQVSKEVVKELVSNDKEFSSKPLNVTVMFLDIRDFTSFADSKSPKEVASFQNIVFSELINIARKHHGIINQILGDGIMATFGAPVITDSHSKDAVKAGYEMIQKINELGNENKIPKIKIGIGLHTGKVLAGNIGNQFRKQYSLTGTTVIIAARIEQLNKIYKSQFLISQSVFKEVRKQINKPQSLGMVDLKGIEKPVEVYQLV